MEWMPHGLFVRWLQYFNEEPWGEIREDMRNVVTLLWQRAQGGELDLPNLFYPYFEDDSPEAMLGKAQEVKDWIREHGRKFNRKTRGDSDGGHDPA